MIKISKSNSQEVDDFGKKEWSKVNIEHYGKNVDYNERKFIFKATENKQIVGSIKGRHEAGVLYIDYLLVGNSQRRKGVGQALMKKAEVFGKKLGAHKVHLKTGKDWNATKFYESLGYKSIAVLPKHHFKKDFLIYEKFIYICE